MKDSPIASHTKPSIKLILKPETESVSINIIYIRTFIFTSRKFLKFIFGKA